MIRHPRRPTRPNPLFPYPPLFLSGGRPADGGLRGERQPGTLGAGARPADAAMQQRLRILPEVRDALASGRPVVALESTILTHGIPSPGNLEPARRVEAEVRAGEIGSPSRRDSECAYGDDSGSH